MLLIKNHQTICSKAAREQHNCIFFLCVACSGNYKGKKKLLLANSGYSMPGLCWLCTPTPRERVGRQRRTSEKREEKKERKKEEIVMDGDVVASRDFYLRACMRCGRPWLAISPIHESIPNITPEKGRKKGWIILIGDKRRAGEGIPCSPPMRNVLRQPHQQAKRSTQLIKLRRRRRRP